MGPVLLRGRGELGLDGFILLLSFDNDYRSG